MIPVISSPATQAPGNSDSPQFVIQVRAATLSYRVPGTSGHVSPRADLAPVDAATWEDAEWQ